MTSKLQKYVTTITGLTVTLFLTLVSDFFLQLPNEITWLTFFMGSIITISTTLLEQRLIDQTSNEFSNKLRIYGLKDQIEDTELRELADKAIDECLQKLQDYRLGVISSTEEGRAYSIKRLSRATTSLDATFWVQNKQALYSLEDSSAGRNYSQTNIDAIRHNIKIRRIFIIKKSDVLDSNGNFADAKALKIMQDQNNAGIDVRISWVEEWNQFGETKELYQDFGIFDGKEVATLRHGIGESQHGTLIIKNSNQVNDYQRVFQRIRNLSRPLNEIVNEHPPLKE